MHPLFAKSVLLCPVVIMLAGFVIGHGFERERPVRYRCEILLDHKSLSVAVDKMKMKPWINKSLIYGILSC